MSASGAKVAVFANHDSKQANALRDALFDLGARPQLFDIQLAGDGRSRVSIHPDRVAWDGVEFEDISAIHIRCTAPKTMPCVPALVNAASFSEYRTTYLREQECMATTYAFFERLVALGKLVVNPLTSAYLDHNAKAQLYQKLRSWGFDAPRTLVTNDVAIAAGFIDDIGEVVIKPSIGVGSTRLVRHADLVLEEDFSFAPSMLQERIRGNTIRVHIVGNTVVLALKIINEGEIDSRTNTKGFEYFKIPDEQEHRLVQANRKLGLHYAAWDIIAGEDGRYVYLDCNPGPYIMWIGAGNVKTVLTELGKYLIGFTETGSVEAAGQRVGAWRP